MGQEHPSADRSSTMGPPAQMNSSKPGSDRKPCNRTRHLHAE